MILLVWLLNGCMVEMLDGKVRWMWFLIEKDVLSSSYYLDVLCPSTAFGVQCMRWMVKYLNRQLINFHVCCIGSGQGRRVESFYSRIRQKTIEIRKMFVSFFVGFLVPFYTRSANNYFANITRCCAAIVIITIQLITSHAYISSAMRTSRFRNTTGTGEVSSPM
jgi:hypothetical protein